MLEDHLKSFSISSKQVLEDMFDIEPLEISECIIDDHFDTEEMVQVNLHFLGSIHGEYILSFSPQAAMNLLNTEDNKFAENEFEFITAMTEALNVIAGSSIKHLGDEVEQINLLSPQIIWGKRFIPYMPTGSFKLGNKNGFLRGHFYINNMKVKLYDSYIKLKNEINQIKNK